MGEGRVSLSFQSNINLKAVRGSCTMCRQSHILFPCMVDSINFMSKNGEHHFGVTLKHHSALFLTKWRDIHGFYSHRMGLWVLRCSFLYFPSVVSILYLEKCTFWRLHLIKQICFPSSFVSFQPVRV